MTERKPFRKILGDAAFTGIVGAILAGVTYWAGLQWIDVFSPNYAPHTIATDTHYITFTE